MPYHISQTDSWSSGQRYEIAIVGELDAATARNLGDWIENARLNGAASFEVDLSQASEVDERALARLLQRNEQLRGERRFALVGREHLAPIARLALYAPFAEALLAAAA